MRETIQNALPYITLALIGLALLLFLLSLRFFRRSRTDVFWRRRREAGQRGWRVFVLAFVLAFLGSISCIFTLLVNVVGDDENSHTLTPTLLIQGRTLSPVPPTDQPLPAGDMLTPPDNETRTALPSTPVFVIITATPIATPTPTLFPTFTPQFTAVVSTITPAPGASLRITALDDEITDTLEPVSPQTSFEAGTERIYLFVAFNAMSEGVLWRRELYKEGVKISGNDYLWGLESDGVGYFFFGQDNGFEPGSYEIRLYIGETDTPASIMPFTVVPTS